MMTSTTSPTPICRFEIPGDPQGKARHRTTKSGHTYTPRKTAQYEELVRKCFRANVPGWEPISDKKPVVAVIEAYFRVPKSTTRQNRLLISMGKLLPAKKPDCDNIAKIVLDSLNTLAYDDDAQVTDLRVIKHYSDNPHVTVTIMEQNTDAV